VVTAPLASTYEGVGLPMVEANAVRRQVVDSSIWFMPEGAVNALLVVYGLDFKFIRAGIRRLSRTQSVKELRKYVKHAQNSGRSALL